MKKLNLVFSVYKSEHWRFGSIKNYFCIGPLYFTKVVETKLEEEISNKVSSVLEKVVDYEVAHTINQDIYKLHLNDGSSVERKFERLVTDIDAETGQHTSKSMRTSINFASQLEKICGY